MLLTKIVVISTIRFRNSCTSQLYPTQSSSVRPLLYAAARSIAGLRRSAHITDTLASFHWLRAPSESSQANGPCLQSSSRHGASLPVRPATSCHWHDITKSSPVVVHQSARRPSVMSSHCRGPVISCCWSKDLEQSPWRHHFGYFTVSLPPLLKTHLFR